MSTISERFAQALQDKFNDLEHTRAKDNQFGIHHEYSITIEQGQKFDRVVIESRCVSDRDRDVPFGHKSVHAFIERATGRLAKSAGWKSPAKWGGDLASRYNLTTQFAEALAVADAHGGYLYQ